MCLGGRRGNFNFLHIVNGYTNTVNLTRHKCRFFKLIEHKCNKRKSQGVFVIYSKKYYVFYF